MTCDFVANLDVMRVTKLDSCGKPIPGPNAFVTECLSSIAMNVQTDDQDDRIYRAANGTLCAVKRGCRTLLGYDIEINAEQVSPEMTEILTGQPGYLDFAGALVGTDNCSIPCNEGFALEFWSELIAPNCSTTGANKFLYILLPWVTNTLLNDLEIGSDTVSFQYIGSSRAGSQWGTGPFNVVPIDASNTPGPMTTPLGATCHRRIITTTVAPPVPGCEFVTVPTPAP